MSARWKGHLKLVGVAVIAGIIGSAAAVVAQQTNYLGTVFIADPTTPTQQLKVNSDGSINVDASGGSGGGIVTKSGTYTSSGTDQFALAVSTNTQLTVPGTTTCAQITVEVASIRRTSDGTSASTTNGTLIPAGASWQDCGPLAAYKFTAVSGSPTVDVEYFH